MHARAEGYHARVLRACWKKTESDVRALANDPSGGLYPEAAAGAGRQVFPSIWASEYRWPEPVRVSEPETVPFHVLESAEREIERLEETLFWQRAAAKTELQRERNVLADAVREQGIWRKTAFREQARAERAEKRLERQREQTERYREHFHALTKRVAGAMLRAQEKARVIRRSVAPHYTEGDLADGGSW